MNREITQIKRITGSQFFTSGKKFAVLKVLAAAAFAWLLCSAAVMADDDDHPFLPTQVRAVSTVPANGDQNPYGVAFVPPGFPAAGTIHPGDILISNFNNAGASPTGNFQGTGTTIIDVPPTLPPFQFVLTKAPETGLSTALNILVRGYVLVGSFPSIDGTLGTATPGSILVFDKSGNSVTVHNKNGTTGMSIVDTLIDGPWDSTVYDQFGKAKLFVSNGLSGAVVRLDLDVDSDHITVKSITQIGTYPQKADAVTFVDAPTGLVYDPNKDVLYVASTLDNAVYAIYDAGDRHSDAGRGTLIYTDSTHLHGPLAMVMAPNGHLLVSNNDVIKSDTTQPSEIVEFTVEGEFVKEISVDPAQGGSFGLAVSTIGKNVTFGAVDDATNLFLIWTFKLHE
jgi:hypothetical protein